MSEVSGYQLDLYCDHGDQHNDQQCANYHNWPTIFGGQNRTAAIRNASRAGWRFHSNGTHSCPGCVKNKKGVPEFGIFESSIE